MSQNEDNFLTIAKDAQAAVIEFQRKLNLQPLSDEEMVARALHLANDITLEEIQEGEFALLCGTLGWPADKVRRIAREHGDAKLAKEWWDANKATRELFRFMLDQCLADPDLAREKLDLMIKYELQGVVAIPQIVWADDELRTNVHYYPASIEAWVAYAVARILDKKSEIGKALRRCKLAACNRYFLSYPSKGGSPRPAYCRPDHRLIAVQLTGSVRTEKWRKRKAKAARKPK